MRAIDADALKEYFFRPYSNEESYSNIDIGHIIDDQPTVNSSAQPDIAEKLYLCKCYVTDEEGLQHEVIHTGDIRRITGWEI